MCSLRLLGSILDEKGAFTHGAFENYEEMCVESPERFEEFCPADMLSLLLKNNVWFKARCTCILEVIIVIYTKNEF